MTPTERRETILIFSKRRFGLSIPPNRCELHMPHVLEVYRSRGFTQGMLLVSFGKAAAPMAKAALEEVPAGYAGQGHCPHQIRSHARAFPSRSPIEVFEAGHPIPDEAGHTAASRVLELLEEADAGTLVLCLISGGGSALLSAPAEGISLADKQKATGLLLRSGATINELNTIRKHLSRVKGGQLAKAAYPAYVISLILSDVIGDNLDVIASGPTSPDPTTYDDAIAILKKYKLRREDASERDGPFTCRFFGRDTGYAEKG